MTTKTIGIVIQGPVKSYGQGPVQSAAGYDATSDILETADILTRLEIPFVISGWEGERKKAGISVPSSVAWLESPPLRNDPDNRQKQFVSTWAGFQYLRNASSPPEYIFKIRTDQVWSEEFFHWLAEDRPAATVPLSSFQNDYLLFSDSIENHPYYLGDFILGGRADDFKRFLRSFLDYPASKPAHPVIGYDYVIRYLLRDPAFKNCLLRGVPLWWQAAHTKRGAPLVPYWHYARRSFFSLIPRKYFISMRWRGGKVEEIIRETVLNRFRFNEDWNGWQPGRITHITSETSSRHAILPDAFTCNMAKDIAIRSMRKVQWLRNAYRKYKSLKN